MASIRKRGARRLSQSKRRLLRNRQQARARHARRQLREIERQAPSALRLLLQSLGDVFTRPTYHRFVVLVLAALLTTGNRTIVNVLRTPAHRRLESLPSTEVENWDVLGNNGTDQAYTVPQPRSQP